MTSSTGRWVSGPDFFDREAEIRILEERVRAANHVLLTGQRRMGKTSIARELGRRLTESGGWVALFVDVEDATCPEDVIADVARAAYPVRPIVSRLSSIATMAQRTLSAVEEIGVSGLRLKFRAELNSGNWRDHGQRLLQGCADHDERVLLVVDELPIFLQTDAERGGWRYAGRGVPKLVERSPSGSRRRLPGPHRVRQHRTRAHGAAPRNT